MARCVCVCLVSYLCGIFEAKRSLFVERVMVADWVGKEYTADEVAA